MLGRALSCNGSEDGDAGVPLEPNQQTKNFYWIRMGYYVDAKRASMQHIKTSLSDHKNITAARSRIDSFVESYVQIGRICT